METKVKYVRYFLILIIISALFAIMWLLGKGRSGLVTTLPLTGSHTAVINKTENFSYSPQTVTISAGDTVRWENVTGTISSINSTPGFPAWNSGSLIAQSYERTFPQKGYYDYTITTQEQIFHGEIIIN